MNRWVFMIATGLMLTLIPATVSAQMMKGSEEGMRGGGMGMEKGMAMGEGMGMHEGMGMDGGMRGMIRMMMAVDHLDLTPDQRKKIRTLRLGHQKEAIPLMGKIRMAGVETEELLMADPVNLEKVKAKTKEKYETMADLEVSHLALEQQVKAVLTPEQRQKVDERMEMRHGRHPGMDSMKGSGYKRPMGGKSPKAAPGQPAPK